MSDEAVPLKRKPGRPSNAEKALRSAKADAPTPKAKKAAPQYNMKAKPNWEDAIDSSVDDTPDRLRIDPSLIPEGMALQWVTDSVLGQSVPHHRAEFERRGWTPIHQDDFDGQFNGMWMPKSAPGEINCDGLVLMARPKQLNDRAKLLDRRKAVEQVALKEQAWKGGDIGTSLDSQHPSAINSNRISKSVERISIPKD